MMQHETEAEAHVIGACLLSMDALAEVAEMLPPHDFYTPKWSMLWEVMLKMYRRGEVVDPVTVNAELGHSGQDRIGGPRVVHDLQGEVFTAANVSVYADIVKSSAAQRRLWQAGDSIRALAEAGGDTVELVEQAHTLLDGVARDALVVKSMADILPDAYDALRAEQAYVETPWPELDMVINGFRPGCLYIVAARPGQGKSLFAGQVAAKLAEHGSVAFSSLEMADIELVHRMMSLKGGVPIGPMKAQRLMPELWEKLDAVRPVLADMPLYVDDSSEVNAHHIREFARQVHRKQPLAGIVVDYMQLMTSGNSSASRQEQVSEFSRQLKIMAKQLHVPVIALAQVNRKAEERADGRPRMSDLRESGAIEQDADAIMILSRDEVNAPSTLLVSIEKHRHGRTGFVELGWNPAVSMIQSYL